MLWWQFPLLVVRALLRRARQLRRHRARAALDEGPLGRAWAGGGGHRNRALPGRTLDPAGARGRTADAAPLGPAPRRSPQPLPRASPSPPLAAGLRRVVLLGPPPVPREQVALQPRARDAPLQRRIPQRFLQLLRDDGRRLPCDRPPVRLHRLGRRGAQQLLADVRAAVHRRLLLGLRAQRLPADARHGPRGGAAGHQPLPGRADVQRQPRVPDGGRRRGAGLDGMGLCWAALGEARRPADARARAPSGNPRPTFPAGPARPRRH